MKQYVLHCAKWCDQARSFSLLPREKFMQVPDQFDWYSGAKCLDFSDVLTVIDVYTDEEWSKCILSHQFCLYSFTRALCALVKCSYFKCFRGFMRELYWVVSNPRFFKIHHFWWSRTVSTLFIPKQQLLWLYYYYPECSTQPAKYSRTSGRLVHIFDNIPAWNMWLFKDLSYL